MGRRPFKLPVHRLLDRIAEPLSQQIGDARVLAGEYPNTIIATLPTLFEQAQAVIDDFRAAHGGKT